MRVSIFGMGYVGCVSGACWSQEGHEIIGVDINEQKVNLINQGLAPMVEPGLSERIRQGVERNLLRATTDTWEAIRETSLSLICVGTPSNADGSLCLDFVERVCADIGKALRKKQGKHVVVIRSTVLPGTTEKRLIPILERTSGKRIGTEWGVCVNPEFLREGCAIQDFYNPPFTLIGSHDAQSSQILEELYASIKAPVYRVSPGTAEMVKYACNAFHALKITFANEIGNLCQAFGLDSHEVMEVFCQDTKLNLSPVYLRPGFAFGGSCLGKDLRTLLHTARSESLNLPVLEAILPSNEKQIDRGLELILSLGKNKVGLIGLSFKSGTDDLRESPMLQVAERLLEKGCLLKVYDQEIALSQLHGSNREFMQKTFPVLPSLICSSMEELIQNSEVVVVSKKLTENEKQCLIRHLTPAHHLVDFVRLALTDTSFQGKYYGLCW